MNIALMTDGDRSHNWAGWTAYASGLASIVQLALLGLFYARGEPFGTLNDAVVVVQYLLALPLILALHLLVHRRGQLLSTVALVLGIGGILAIAVLQILLIARVLSFAQQVGPVSAAIWLLFGGSILITGYLGRRLSVLPDSLRMSILGWTFVGYPIWAFWLGGRLRVGAAQFVGDPGYRGHEPGPTSGAPPSAGEPRTGFSDPPVDSLPR